MCRIVNQMMLAAMCLLALFAVSLNGCGGCSATGGSSGVLTKEMIETRRKAWQADVDAENSPAPPAQEAGAKAPSLPPPPPPPSPPVVKPASQDDGEATRPLAKTLPKPARPKDVADWKRDDYYSAKQDSDPRLVDAVRRLGEHFADNANAADLLANLLESPANAVIPSTSDDEDAPRKGLTMNASLAEAIVSALAANGTPKARQTLELIADGSLRTANDQATASALLKTLQSRPDKENEDLLVRMLTMPDEAASEGQTTTAREKIRAAAIAMIASTASETFRVRLATAMIAPETPQAAYDQLWGCLKQPRAENLAAQMVIYQSDRPDAKTVGLLEHSFAFQSSEVMSRLLGVRLPKKGADTATPYRTAERMWIADFAAALQQQLSTLDTLASGTKLVGLASTVPNPSLRAALLRTLERHWDQGPRGLEFPGAGEKITREPGFVVLLKMLPHRDAAKVSGAKDMARSAVSVDPEAESADGAAPGRIPSSPRTTKAAAMFEVKRRQEQTAQQWAEFSYGVVNALCQQLHAITKARQAGAARVEWSLDDIDLSFKPHPRGTIVAAYQLNWPSDLQDKIDPAPLLRVRYVRIEQKAQPTKVLAYYRRQVAGGDEHAIPNGLWIESLDTIKEQGTVRSVDVFLTKASASVPGLVDQEQELTVEILTVECPAIVPKGSQ